MINDEALYALLKQHMTYPVKPLRLAENCQGIMAATYQRYSMTRPLTHAGGARTRSHFYNINIFAPFHQLADLRREASRIADVLHGAKTEFISSVRVTGLNEIETRPKQLAQINLDLTVRSELP